MDLDQCLRSLIPQWKAQSAATEKRLADLIITMEIKRIQANHTLEKRLGELRALIPVYKARNPTYEHERAKQIIDLDLQLIAAKSTQFPIHPTALHSQTVYLFVPQPPLLQPFAPQPPAPQQLQLNDMAEFLNKRPRQIPNLYWQPGKLIGVPLRTLRQFKFIPLSNALPDLDLALAGARVDCARDLHKQLIEFSGAAKDWMTIQVEYEPVNPLANKQPFEQYLSAAPTRMFKRDGPFSAFTNPYINTLHILKDRIREFDAKFIKDKSGLRL